MHNQLQRGWESGTGFGISDNVWTAMFGTGNVLSREGGFAPDVAGGHHSQPRCRGCAIHTRSSGALFTLVVARYIVI